MSSTDYLAAEQLKASLELTGTVFADGDIGPAITAASRGIDNACNRRFYPDTVDATRYYTPQDPYCCLIDDLYAFTSLNVDQTADGVFEQSWTLNTWFTLEPLNAAADGWPYTRIVANPRWSWGLPSWYPRSVQLTGRFGWASVPGAVTEATTILATQLLKRAREAPFGVVAIGVDVGAVSRIAVTDPQIKMLIAPYMRERPEQ